MLADKDVLKHKLVAIEKQRRHLVKTLRCEEVPPEFFARAGTDQILGIHHFIATSQITEYAILQQAYERKSHGGRGATQSFRRL